jgi:hypothetical protein
MVLGMPELMTFKSFVRQLLIAGPGQYFDYFEFLKTARKGFGPAIAHNQKKGCISSAKFCPPAVRLPGTGRE